MLSNLTLIIEILIFLATKSQRRDYVTISVQKLIRFFSFNKILLGTMLFWILPLSIIFLQVFSVVSSKRRGQIFHSIELKRSFNCWFTLLLIFLFDTKSFTNFYINFFLTFSRFRVSFLLTCLTLLAEDRLHINLIFFQLRCKWLCLILLVNRFWSAVFDTVSFGKLHRLFDFLPLLHVLFVAV